METQACLQLPSTGMRIVVQHTFIEVVEEGSSQPPQTTVKRAFSAPVSSGRGGSLSPGDQEDEAECPDGPSGVAQQSQGEEGQPGQEPKTTVAVRNIPLHFTRDQLLQHLDAEGFAGQCDFLYLPIDFAKCQNVGYAYVNLTRPKYAQRILAELDGRSWGEPGEGQTVVGWSLTQGLDLLIERYRNSPVMHESMPDDCKPIVLQGGVRVDFPPPTKKLQRLRRLRTRCRSRGRAVPSSGFGAEDSCTLLPGLSRAPSGANQDMDAILASPLLAGLRLAGAEAPTAAPRPRRGKATAAERREAEALSECPATTPAAPPRKRASWADLQEHDDYCGGCSECSTQAPGYFSGAPSSDGSSDVSDGAAAGRRGSGCSAQPWSGSMLAQGLLPAVQEEKGERPPRGMPRRGSLIEVVGTHP